MKRNFWMRLIHKRPFRQREILAFSHIPKTAGTTLTHLFRSNFFLRFCSVENLQTGIQWAFTAEQLDLVLIINPLIKCIGGHTVRPFSNISEKYPNIKYITLMRDPILRYISQYIYNKEFLRNNINNFDDFLSKKSEQNMQIKRITGSEDLGRAIEILNSHFLLVGITEEFDGFLLLLKHKLKPTKFEIGYQKKNISQHSRERTALIENMDKYVDHIREANCLDIKLYDYVKNKLWKKVKEAYGPSYEFDLKAFQAVNKGYSNNIYRYMDYILRKCYYDPILKVIGRISGTSMHSSTKNS